MRLIDADALNYSTHTECAGHGEYYDIEIITKSKIDNAPTIDAEPVVRCRDCWKLNRLKKYTGFGDELFVCENTKMTVYETDFCSYGERREP